MAVLFDSGGRISDLGWSSCTLCGKVCATPVTRGDLVVTRNLFAAHAVRIVEVCSSARCGPAPAAGAPPALGMASPVAATPSSVAGRSSDGGSGVGSGVGGRGGGGRGGGVGVGSGVGSGSGGGGGVIDGVDHAACRQAFCRQFAVRANSISPYLHCCFDIHAVARLYDTHVREGVTGGDERVALCRTCFDGFKDMLTIVDKYG